MTWLDWKTMWAAAVGEQPPVRVRYTSNDNLYEDGLTRGTVIIGDPGTGKTRYAAMQIVKKFKEHPDQAIFVFDWSGPLTNTILDIISKDRDYRNLLSRVVLDELGNESYVCPMPEFHKDYGLTDEEQANRVSGNFKKLASIMSKTAEFLTEVSVTDIGMALCKLLIAVVNSSYDSLQITEGKDLLLDINRLKQLVAKYGGRQPTAKRYFEREFLDEKFVVPRERELQSKALRHILGAADGEYIRAALGYFRPGWTPKEAIDRGQLILIDAHKMNNLEYAQHYLIIQKFSLIMNYINKREADDPTYKPATIAFDETYTILKIPGMADWLGMVSPLYRNRKVQLIIIIQALWQLDEKFREQLWSLANVVSFSVSRIEEAKEVARQLFKYEPAYIKTPSKTDTQNATTESESGQDRLNADWLKNLPARQVVMRRMITEQKKENIPAYIVKTTDMPSYPSAISVKEIKYLLINDSRRYVFKSEALEFVNHKFDKYFKEVTQVTPRSGPPKT